MAIRKVEHVNLPYAGRRTSPDNSRLSALYSRGGEVLADIALRKGENAARMYGQLAGLFTNFQETGRQKQATEAAKSIRAAEREQDRLEREAERKEREAERKEAVRISRETQDRMAASRLVDDVAPGPVADTPESRVMLDLANRFPETAARFRRTTTLPARSLDPAIGALAPPSDLTVRVPTGAEARAAGQDQFARERDAAAQAERTADNARADTNLARQLAAQKATETHYGNMERISQQNADTARQRLTGTGVSLDMDAPFVNALDRAILMAPATKRGPIATLANRLWASGDKDAVKGVIKQAAIEGENVDAKNQIRGRQVTLAALADARQILADMQKAGVNTNILTGTAEDLARKLGTSTNPQLAMLKTRLLDSVIQYRRAATGVQFSERESADYETMFPNYRQTLPVNLAVLEGLERAVKTNDRTYWENKLGPEGADLVVGPATAAPRPSGAPPSGVKVLSITPVPKP